jgi:hypothetical protein
VKGILGFWKLRRQDGLLPWAARQVAAGVEIEAILLGPLAAS